MTALAVALAAAVLAQVGLIVALVAWYRAAVPDKARADVLQVRLDESHAANAELVKRLTTEIKRADALDALLADHAVSGPVIGSFERLLQKWRTLRATADRAVPVAAAPSGTARTPGPDDLMRPED